MDFGESIRRHSTADEQLTRRLGRIMGGVTIYIYMYTYTPRTPLRATVPCPCFRGAFRPGKITPGLSCFTCACSLRMSFEQSKHAFASCHCGQGQVDDPWLLEQLVLPRSFIFMRGIEAHHAAPRTTKAAKSTFQTSPDIVQK